MPKAKYVRCVMDQRRIRAAMHRAGFTRSQLAAAIGVHPSVMGEIIAGKQAVYEARLLLLTKTLKCDPEAIVESDATEARAPQPATPRCAVDGSKLRRLRNKHRLTQIDLAELSGLTNHRISTIETGRARTKMGDELHELAMAFGVDDEELAFTEPQPDLPAEPEPLPEPPVSEQPEPQPEPQPADDLQPHSDAMGDTLALSWLELTMQEDQSIALGFDRRGGFFITRGRVPIARGRTIAIAARAAAHIYADVMPTDTWRVDALEEIWQARSAISLVIDFQKQIVTWLTEKHGPQSYHPASPREFLDHTIAFVRDTIREQTSQ